MRLGHTKVRKVFGQVVCHFFESFGQIFGQGFDQGSGEGKNHKYNVQYYPALRKTVFKPYKKLLKSLTLPL